MLQINKMSNSDKVLINCETFYILKRRKNKFKVKSLKIYGSTNIPKANIYIHKNRKTIFIYLKQNIYAP